MTKNQKREKERKKKKDVCSKAVGGPEEREPGIKAERHI